jgi:hypothetical protein
VTLSNIRSTVIENFLTSVEFDQTIQATVTGGLRKLLTGTSRLPDADQLVALIQQQIAEETV